MLYRFLNKHSKQLASFPECIHEKSLDRHLLCLHFLIYTQKNIKCFDILILQMIYQRF